MADPTIFEYQIQDDQGVSSRTSVYEAYNATTTTVESLIGSWLQLGGLIDPVIDGEILEGRITIPLQKSGTWKAAPVEGNNVNQVMTVNFENDFNSYLTPLLLPSYKESQLNADGSPNLAATALGREGRRRRAERGVRRETGDGSSSSPGRGSSREETKSVRRRRVFMRACLRGDEAREMEEK